MTKWYLCDYSDNWSTKTEGEMDLAKLPTDLNRIRGTQAAVPAPPPRFSLTRVRDELVNRLTAQRRRGGSDLLRHVVGGTLVAAGRVVAVRVVSAREDATASPAGDERVAHRAGAAHCRGRETQQSKRSVLRQAFCSIIDA